MARFRLHDGFDGEFLGYADPITLDTQSGRAAFQVVDEDGTLLGIIYPNACYDSPYASGNKEWSLSEMTADHKRIMRLSSEAWNTDGPIVWTPCNE